MTTPTLNGHTALVTGGSRGIGAAIVRSLAEAGVAVAINYRERAGEANTLATAIGEAGGRVIAIAADVSRSDAVTHMVQRVTSDLGPIDILINNAGIAITRSIEDLSETDFDQTIAVNLKSVFLCTQTILPAMRAKGWGRIVNISSGAARGAGSIGPHYNASKAGIEGLTRGYAARLVKEGITVNAVAPSLIETDMMKAQPNLVSRIPVGRFGRADEVVASRHDAARQSLYDRSDGGDERRHDIQLTGNARRGAGLASSPLRSCALAISECVSRFYRSKCCRLRRRSGLSRSRIAR